MQKKPQQPKRKTLPKGRCSQFEHSYTASCTPDSSNGTSEMYDKEASIKFFNKALRTGDLKEVQNPISTYTVHGVTPKKHWYHQKFTQSWWNLEVNQIDSVWGENFDLNKRGFPALSALITTFTG
jgi:hypothetical protein